MPAVTQWPPTMSAEARTIWAAEPATLPPLTQAIRNTYAPSVPWPVASAEAIATLLAAIYDLEQRVTALEG